MVRPLPFAVLAILALAPGLVINAPAAPPAAVADSRAVDVGHLSLRDAARDKDLWLRVSFPREPGRNPLIVFSHGAWSSRDEYQPLVAHWVRSGYVVVQANHSDSSQLGGSPGWNSFRDWVNRPRDISFVIDSIPMIESRVPGLAGRIDASRIGVGGHSFGGMSAQLIAGARVTGTLRGERDFRDERVTAVLLLSPPGSGDILSKESWDGVKVPLMTVTGTNDNSRRRGRDYTWRMEPYEYTAPGDNYLLLLEGADHDLGGISGTENSYGWVADAAQVRIVQRVTTQFWDAFLKRDAAAGAFLRGSERIVEDGASATLSHKSARQTGTDRRPPGAGTDGGSARRVVDAGRARDAAYDPRAPAMPVAEELAAWTDAARGRTIPVKIYSPRPGAARERLPAVVFSHGLGESRESFHYLGTRWAQQGYIAVFVSHPGSDYESIERDGMPRGDTARTWDPRPGDMRFVVDRLVSGATGSPLLDGRVDAERLAAGGQCLGATTAFFTVGLRVRGPGGTPYASPDPRIKAAIALSPQMPIEKMLAQSPIARLLSFEGGSSDLYEGSWSQIDRPAMVVTGSEDFSYFRAVRDNPELRRMAYDNMPGGAKFLVDVLGAGHEAFTDSDPWYPAFGKRDPRHHELIATATTAFLDAYLKEEPAARRWLIGDTLEATTGEVTQENKLANPERAAIGGAARPGAASRHPPAPARARLAVMSTEAESATRTSFEVRTVSELTLDGPGRAQPVHLRVSYPLAEGRFPVIVFSHYQGGTKETYADLAETWARHGYVVVLPDHADAEARRQGAWGGTPAIDVPQRYRDLLFVVENLRAVSRARPAGAGDIDARRIGVGGHYVGALAASLLGGASWQPPGGGELLGGRNAGVSGVLLVSPVGRGQGVSENSWNGMRLPVMVVTGSGDYSRRTGNDPQWRAEPFRFAPPGDKYLVYIEGYQTRRPPAGEPVAYTEVLVPEHARYVRSATLAFWDAALKGRPEALERLRVGGSAAAYATITVR
jgi:predicted dienelactone hydrolase